MDGDTLNGGQGLLPYADPDCKSESGRHFLIEKGDRAAERGGTRARRICLQTALLPPGERSRYLC